MRTSTVEKRFALAVRATVNDHAVIVDLDDGRTVTVLLAWYPRLPHGTARERRNWRLIGGGEGIHWVDLDEDLSVEGLLAGRPSAECQASLKKWLADRPRRASKRMQPTTRRTRRG